MSKYQKSKSKRDIILSNFQWNHNHEIRQNFERRPSKNASKIFYTCGLCISLLNALRIDFWWLNFSPSILSIFFFCSQTLTKKVYRKIISSWLNTEYVFLFNATTVYKNNGFVLHDVKLSNIHRRKNENLHFRYWRKTYHIIFSFQN